MSTGVHAAGPAVGPRRPWLLGDLERPSAVVAHLTPNWFASVMGTGIVAVAAASLPWQPPGMRGLALVAWSLACLLLVLVTTGTVLHWVRHPATARRHHHDPVMMHFYGALPMALLTVGAGTVLVGSDVLGEVTAARLDGVLWCAGTALGVLTAVTVPVMMVRRPRAQRGVPFGGRLMAVVPPMVSASTGALLVPALPDGPLRTALLAACYAMFVVATVASAVVIAQIWRRVLTRGVGPAAGVPTLWIVLGPLGQSVTAANLLGGVAHLVVPEPYAGALQSFGVRYGLPVYGAALLWAGVAAAVTVRTARENLPFSLTWWSFTFPVGTCVTAAGGLALHTGSTALQVAAVLSFAVLLTAWSTVAGRTLHGVLRGRLLLPPSPAAAT